MNIMNDANKKRYQDTPLKNKEDISLHFVVLLLR